MRSAVWAVPAVAAVSASPAFALSGEPEYGAFLMSTGVVSEDRRTFTVTSSGVTVPLTLTITVVTPPGIVLGAYGGTNSNYATAALSDTSPAADGLLLQHHRDVQWTGNAARHTFTFSRPVSDLRLRLAGVGSNRPGAQEHVAVRPGMAIVDGTQGDGINVAVDPGIDTRAWGRTAGETPTSAAHQVELTLAGPASSFTVSCSRVGGDSVVEASTQEAYIGDISFTTA